MRIACAIGLIVASICASGAAQAERVVIDNQRGEKVKFCTYRSDDESLIRPRLCWMLRPGAEVQWQRGEDDFAYDVRLFEPGAFELPICIRRNIRDSYKIQVAPRSTKSCVQAFARQSVPVRQWKRNDRVLMNWSADRFWYPATIMNSLEHGYRVRLDNGRVVRSDPRYLTHLSIAAGARVEVNWKGQGRWYPGYVTDTESDTVTVRFDDGFTEKSALMRVRLELVAGSPEE